MAHRCFETLFRPLAILEAQVKESDFAPDDGQTPKNDESLLDDVGAGDPRHRLSFAIEPHERGRTGRENSRQNGRNRGQQTI